MFEERTVHNAHINFKDRLYGSPELADYNGETVLISENRLYPAAVAVLGREYQYICLAKNKELWERFRKLGNRQQIMNAIETAIIRDEAENGPAKLRAYTLDEWVRKIDELVDDASRHASYGNTHHTLDSLLKASVEIVQCLEYHIEAEAVKGTPVLAEAIASLDGGRPTEDSKEATDSGATETAA